MHPTLALPAELTIYTVCELRTQWLAWLAGVDDDTTIDAAEVEQLDAAGVQLLASLCRSVHAKQLGLRVARPSAALRSACVTLGMEGLLAADGSCTMDATV